MNYISTTRLVLVCMSSVVPLTGCHSWYVETRPITRIQNERNSDTIFRVTRTNGTEELMRDVRVESGALRGERVIHLYGKRNRTHRQITTPLSVPVLAIQSVEVWKFEPAQTLAVTLAVTSVATAAILYVVVGSGLAGLAAHD